MPPPCLASRAVKIQLAFFTSLALTASCIFTTGTTGTMPFISDSGTFWIRRGHGGGYRVSSRLTPHEWIETGRSKLAHCQLPTILDSIQTRFMTAQSY